MEEYEVRELLEKTNFPFLAAYHNEWINADRKRISFDEMGKSYLKNCYKMLQKQRYSIEHGFFLAGVEYDKEQYDEIVDITNRLYNDKMEEIKNYLK